MLSLKSVGKATAAILKLIMAPQVGREDICDAIGYIENAGTPNGSVTPDFVGQSCLDTTNSVWYRAKGTTNTDWVLLGLAGVSQAELAVLDGASNANSATGKAAILGTSGALTIAGSLTVGATTISEAEIGVLDSAVAGTPAASKALVADANVGVGSHREKGTNLYKQAAPAAKTTAVTLTAAEIFAGLLTANQGGGAAANYQMPAGADIETALLAAHAGLQNDDSFDFTIVNISANAAEDITLTTNTNITLVGNVTIASNAAVTDQAWGTFRVRRTAANTYSVYRVG